MVTDYNAGDETTQTYCVDTDAIQVGGDHYKSLDVQPWEAMSAWMSDEAFHGFLHGNVIKYVARFRSKGGAEDLRKARHYLDKLISVIE